ncbi:MAG: ACT domain-containing protein [Anaerolineae bacterium]|nr:ACT domain-containing protein [Anaerolineae bacterium]
MMKPKLKLTLIPELFAICRFHRDEPLPGEVLAAQFYSVTRTCDELSIICPQDCVPTGTRCETGWRVLKFEGPFEFSLVGILHSVTAPLAKAQVSIFALSTYDTDYVLVKETQLETAISVLSACGHVIQPG